MKAMRLYGALLFALLMMNLAFALTLNLPSKQVAFGGPPTACNYTVTFSNTVASFGVVSDDSGTITGVSNFSLSGLATEAALNGCGFAPFPPNTHQFTSTQVIPVNGNYFSATIVGNSANRPGDSVTISGTFPSNGLSPITLNVTINRTDQSGNLNWVVGWTNLQVTTSLSAVSLSGPSTVNAGGSDKFSLLASYADGSSIYAQPVWSVTGNSGTVAYGGNFNPAVLQGQGTPDANIVVTATYTENGITKTVSMNVSYKGNALTGLGFIQSFTSVSAGGTVQYTAQPIYTRGPGLPSVASWSVSNSSAATISSTGLLTGLAVSVDTPVTVTATVTVSGVTKSATTTITVKASASSVTLSSINTTCALNAGSETSGTCATTASYSNGTTKQVNASLSCSSSPLSNCLAYPLVFSGNTFTVTPIIDSNSSTSITNSLQIYASYTEGNSGTQTTSTSVNVITIKGTKAAITALSISGPGSVSAGSSASFSASASYSNSASLFVTPIWSVSNNTAATISATGVLTAQKIAVDTPVTVTASYTDGGVTKTATAVVTIKAAQVTNALASLLLSGGNSVSAGSTLTLSAKAFYSDGAGQAVTPTWSVSNTSAATINANGVLTGLSVVADTPVTVTASYTEGGITQTATISVTIKAAPVAACPGFQNLNSGGDTNLTLSATVQPCAGDIGKQANIYVVAIVPIFGTNTILFLTPTGWAADPSGLTNPPAYKKGPLVATTTIPLVANTNLSPFKGLTVLVGFGTGTALSSDTAIWGTLLTNSTYSAIYTVQ